MLYNMVWVSFLLENQLLNIYQTKTVFNPILKSTCNQSLGPCTTGNINLNIYNKYDNSRVQHRMGPSQGAAVLGYFLCQNSFSNQSIYFSYMTKVGC